MVVFSGTVQSDFQKFIPAKLEDKVKLLDFAASDFATYRDTLLDYVKANFPLDYNYFEESDFGMLLVELMAAVGHIQSHKSDYLANENFLRTASERSSVQKLLELIGVRMKGPISAVADASLTFVAGVNGTSSITLTPDQRVIATTSPEDGAAVTYTIYKVNPNGTVDLDSNSHSIEFNFSEVDAGDTVTVASAVLMEGALAVEGGTFGGGDAVKTVNLTQSPYVEKSAQIFVDGTATTRGIYTEEENIYFASGASDKVFQVTTDQDFRASILFGDNTVGMSPAVGDTYSISYRVGGGTRGNVAAGYINAVANGTTNKGDIPSVTIQNSSIATGGTDAESVGRARRYAPLYFRSQDRIVTLADYKAFVNYFTSNYGSTGKGTASVRRAYSSANIIDVFVFEKASHTQLKRATREYKRQLLEAMEPKKMISDEPVIVDGLIRTIDLQVGITMDRELKSVEPQMVSRARTLIMEYFNVDNRDFGQEFIPQDVVRAVLEGEPRIRFATVDNIQADAIVLDFNEIIQLNNLTITARYI